MSSFGGGLAAAGILTVELALVEVEEDKTLNSRRALVVVTNDAAHSDGVHFMTPLERDLHKRQLDRCLLQIADLFARLLRAPYQRRHLV